MLIIDYFIVSYGGFFILSGITFSVKRKFFKGGYFLDKKIKSIILPYFLFCLSMFIEKSKLFSIIGKNSIYYYGFYYEVLVIVKKIVSYAVLQPIVTLVILMPIVSIYVWLKKSFMRKEHD